MTSASDQADLISTGSQTSSDFPKSRSEKRRVTLVYLLLALATSAVYCEVVWFDFTNYDEFFMILKNPIVQSGVTLQGTLWALTTSWFEYWHPVTWLSHMLDCELFGLRPGWHHAISLAFHVANTLLVFAVLKRMTGALLRSAIVAALFGLHPLHVESVAWIAERKDLLSAFFFLLSLGAYTRFVEHAKLQDPKAKLWYRLSLLSFAFALMSKPMAMTLPFVLLLLDYWPLERLELDVAKSPWNAFGSLLREKFPFFALTLASCFVTYVGVKAGGNFLSAEKVSWSLRLSNVPVSYARYLGKLVWPADLVVLYPMPQHWVFWQVAGAVLLLVGLTIWVVLRARSAPYLVVGWFFFLGVLVPTIGLLQVGFQSIADRYTYIPFIGLFIAVVWALAEATKGRPWRTPLLFTLTVSTLAVCSLLTWHQADFWRNSLNLWTHCVSVTPENAIARYNLGYVLQYQGKLEQAKDHYLQALRLRPDHLEANLNLGTLLVLDRKMVEATNYFVKTLRLKPDYAAAHANMGLALRELGDYDGAMAHCAEAIRLNPTRFEPFNDMARSLSARGRSADSLYYYSESLQRNPANPQTHFYLGLDQLTLGQINEAVSSLNEAVRLAPGWPDAHLQLAIALAASGATSNAVAQYREALRLDSSLPVALNNLAWILATHPDSAVRNGAEAVRLAEQACDRTAWKQTLFIGTLSAAYAEAGNFEKAVATSQKACVLASSLGETNLFARNQELLRQFQNHQPCRDPN
jgi:tetratricopeptide (TPR) repeat protein